MEKFREIYKKKYGERYGEGRYLIDGTMDLIVQEIERKNKPITKYENEITNNPTNSNIPIIWLPEPRKSEQEDRPNE